MRLFTGLCMTLLALSCWLSAGDFPVHGKSIILDRDDSSVDDPNNIIMEWSFAGADLFDAARFINMCDNYCNSNVKYMKYYTEMRACKYLLASNVFDYVSNNKNFDGLYSLQLLEESRSTVNQMERASIVNNDNIFQTEVQNFVNSYDYGDDNKVAILVPSTSMGYTSLDELPLLKYLLKSLTNSITSFEKLSIILYIGYDSGDPIYDNELNMSKITQLMKESIPLLEVKTVKLSGFQGKIVHIWNDLTKRAYNDGCAYYFLLGDDVVINKSDWINEMTKILRTKNSNTPNLGTVAFYDIGSPNFPTFPVFHRTHLLIFGADNAFDPYFTNTFADPWISDIYVSFNSSYIASGVSLSNIIGGVDSVKNIPRYNPKHPHIENYIDLVQRGRRRIAQYLKGYWSPTMLAYGEEGLFYKKYCEASGCIVRSTEYYQELSRSMSRPLFYA